MAENKQELLELEESSRQLEEDLRKELDEFIQELKQKTGEMAELFAELNVITRELADDSLKYSIRKGVGFCLRAPRQTNGSLAGPYWYKKQVFRYGKGKAKSKVQRKYISKKITRKFTWYTQKLPKDVVDRLMRLNSQANLLREVRAYALGEKANFTRSQKSFIRTLGRVILNYNLGKWKELSKQVKYLKYNQKRRAGK